MEKNTSSLYDTYYRSSTQSNIQVARSRVVSQLYARRPNHTLQLHHKQTHCPHICATYGLLRITSWGIFANC